jgi:hypothetical protein
MATPATHVTHDLKALEASLGSLVAQARKFGATEDLEELRLKIVPRPGWTTPAEFLLVKSAVDALRAQLQQAQVLRDAVVNASRSIGQ